MAYNSATDEAEAAAYEAPARSSYFSLPAQDAALASVDAPAAEMAPPAETAASVDELEQPAQTVAPAEVAPRPVPQPPVAPRPAPVAPAPMAQQAPVAPAARSLPKVQAYALSIEDLQQVAQASGLEWVNSDAQKVAQAQAAIAAEPKPIHVPREPRPPVMIDEGPLVLVETRKDLRNMTLPFEG
jgi:ribonuclease E